MTASDSAEGGQPMTSDTSEVPASAMSTLDKVKSYIQVLRLDHWHKNVLTVLGALACIAVLKIDVNAKILGCMIRGTFISCLIPSVNYIREQTRNPAAWTVRCASPAYGSPRTVLAVRGLFLWADTGAERRIRLRWM